MNHLVFSGGNLSLIESPTYHDHDHQRGQGIKSAKNCCHSGELEDLRKTVATFCEIGIQQRIDETARQDRNDPIDERDPNGNKELVFHPKSDCDCANDSYTTSSKILLA